MKNPWFPLYDGDLLANTMHLSPTEFGIYVRLIIHAYNHHGEIPGDAQHLCRITGCAPQRWHFHEKTVLQFFDPVEGGDRVHKRVVHELARSHEISNKRKAAALQMHSKRHANAEQTMMQTRGNHNTTQRKKEPHTPVARSNGSGGGGSLSQAEQDRLIAAYERQTGKPWDQTAHLGGTMSPEHQPNKR